MCPSWVKGNKNGKFILRSEAHNNTGPEVAQEAASGYTIIVQSNAKMQIINFFYILLLQHRT